MEGSQRHEMRRIGRRRRGVDEAFVLDAERVLRLDAVLQLPLAGEGEGGVVGRGEDRDLTVAVLADGEGCRGIIRFITRVAGQRRVRGVCIRTIVSGVEHFHSLR